jgi:hypothetical protein
MSSPRGVSRVSPVLIYAGHGARTRVERTSLSHPSLGVPGRLVTAAVTNQVRSCSPADSSRSGIEMVGQVGSARP